MKARALLVLLFGLMPTSGAEEVMLNRENWSMVEESADIWAIEYYSKMCGSCKEFEPTWESLSEELKLSSKVKVGRCSIDDRQGMKLAQEQGILDRGIPAVQIVHGAQKSDILMAGKIIPRHQLKTKIEASLSKAAAAPHPETGLLQRGEL